MTDHRNLDGLSAHEAEVMRMTLKATMLRAAAIIDAITNEDVADAQMALFEAGVKIQDLAKLDRALIASCHLRACAEMSGVAGTDARASVILSDLKARV